MLGSKTCYVNTYDRTSAANTPSACPSPFDGFINTNINFCGAACGRFVYTDAIAETTQGFTNQPNSHPPNITPQSLVFVVYIIIPFSTHFNLHEQGELVPLKLCGTKAAWEPSPKMRLPDQRPWLWLHFWSLLLNNLAGLRTFGAHLLGRVKGNAFLSWWTVSISGSSSLDSMRCTRKNKTTNSEKKIVENWGKTINACYCGINDPI